MTKKTPFELIIGYVPLAHQPARSSNLPSINARLKLIKETQMEAKAIMSKSQEQLIKTTKYKEFKEGEKVWLEGMNIKRPYVTNKLSPRQYGPFKVVTKISKVAYQLELLEI